jgi:hypothetical protein
MAWMLAAALMFSIQVQDTAGIRRNGFPAHATAAIPRGTMTDVAQARLMLNGKEVPAQFTVAAKWPDGSTQSLDVDWNASVGPMETAAFQLEVGEGVKSDAAGRGLTVAETADAIQVGNVKFSKTAMPLVASVNYRQEDVAPGPNGFVVTDVSGASFDMSHAESLQVEIRKRGPLFVLIRYTGTLRMGGDTRVPFTIDVEMPNSKTWVKASATFDDPSRRVRDVSFHSPLALGAFPWVWDFGTGSWTYGSIRNKTDNVVFTQTIKSPMAGAWTVATGPKGQEQPYEAAGGRRLPVAEGWAHVQDAKEAIAFAIDNFGREAGMYSMTLDGEGHVAITFAPIKPAARHQLSLFQHFVATPVPIGAVTSPVSMMSPLMVTMSQTGK